MQRPTNLTHRPPNLTNSSKAVTGEKPQQPAKAAGKASKVGLAPYASEVHVLLPSTLYFRLALVLPFLAWIITLSIGVIHFVELPAKKWEVRHALTWFDKTIFRTVGPLLPLAVLALRWLSVGLPYMLYKSSKGPGSTPPASTSAVQSTAATPRYSTHSSTSAVQGTTATHRYFTRASASAVQSTTATHRYSTRASTSAVQSTTATPGHSTPGSTEHLLAPAQPLTPVPPSETRTPARCTIPGACLMVYITVGLCRVVLYSMHLFAQAQAEDIGIASVHGVAWMSDHILLAASVVVCLQVEMVCSVSDFIKTQAKRSGLLQGLLCTAAFLIAALLYAATTLDMYFTASKFHVPPESMTAVVLGAVLFQIPVLLWLQQRFDEGPWSQNSRVAGHADKDD